jgi:hypothetical protein
MGATKSKESLADDETLFRYLCSQNENDIRDTLRRFWKEEVKNESDFIEKKEALDFFERVYNHLAKDKVIFNSLKEDLIKAWSESFDTNDDGKISFEEFTTNIEKLLKGELTPLKQIGVLELNKIVLTDLPTMNFHSETNACFEVSTKVNGILDNRKVPTIQNHNYPEFTPGFLYFPTTSLSDFTFSISDEDSCHKEVIGTYIIDGQKIFAQLSTELKDTAQFIEFEGDIDLSSQANAVCQKGNRHPRINVSFKYEVWDLSQWNKDNDTSMNKFNRMFWLAMLETRAPPVEAKDVKLPKSKKAPTYQPFTEHIRICTKDHTRKNFGPMAAAFTTAICSLQIDEDEKDIPWNDPVDGRKVIASNMGRYIPKPNEGYWTDTTSDDAFSRFFFQGIGVTRLAKLPDGKGFCADFDSLSKYKVKKGFERYQGKAFFNPLGVLDHIEYKGKKYFPPNNHDNESKKNHWEHLKFLLRSTALITVTTCENLTIGHLLWSNLTIAASISCLSPDHPIRRFLHIHTYRSAYVNQCAANMILSDRGALLHMTAWDYSELKKVIDDSYTTYKFESFSQFLQRTGMYNVDPNLYPFGQDGMDYWNAVRKYVTEYIYLFYSNEQKLHADNEFVEFWTQLSATFPGGLPPLLLPNVIEVLTEFIFYVSGIHTHVGSLGAYCRDPRFAAGCVGEGQTQAFPQHLYTQVALTVGTAGQMPRMSQDWSHLLPNKEAMGVWRKFHEEMCELQTTIEARNKSRKHPFNNFNPEYIETSIAV